MLSISAPCIAEARVYKIRQTVAVKDVPANAKQVRLWVPIPTDGTWQHVLDRRVVEQNVLRNLLDKLTVRSDVFGVESVGVSAGGVQRRIFAVIDRGQKPVGILYWYQTQ